MNQNSVISDETLTRYARMTQTPKQRAWRKLDRDVRPVSFNYGAKLRFLAAVHAQTAEKRDALIKATDIRDGTCSGAAHGWDKKASNPWAGFDASDASDARAIGAIETVSLYTPAPVASEVETDGELALAVGE